MKITFTKAGLFAYLSLGRYGLTVYPYQLPTIRHNLMALYDYVDAITDFPNRKTEAQLWELVGHLRQKMESKETL